MQPKFAIGESVIVVPTDTPAFITTVTDMKQSTAWILSGVKHTGWGYMVDPNSNISGLPWAEHCLRKRPKGNGRTLTEFMDSLKQPEVN